MKELKLDLTPERLRNAAKEKSKSNDEGLNPARAAAEFLPESERSPQDGPGRE